MSLSLILMLAAGMLAECEGPHNVKTAQLRDTLFSVEETKGGAYRLFFTHDDVAGYCTLDVTLGKKAQELLLTDETDREVILTFHTIVNGSLEDSWWDSSDCGSVVTGSETSMTWFAADDIRAATGK